MPARASSASCRGAAAAAASESSSLRRGRCCSEPAMGARGPARAEARCGRRLQRPALPEPRSDLPGASRAQQPAGGGEGREGGAAARLRRGERGRPAAPTRRPGLLSSRLAATPAVSDACARSDPAGPEPPPLPAAPPGPGTGPRGPRAGAQAADTHVRPQGPVLPGLGEARTHGKGGRA